MKSSAVWVVAAICVVAVCTSRDARALAPPGVELTARVGGGTSPFSGDPINALGLGIGARSGVSFLDLYAGLSFMYYFGGSASLGRDVSDSSILYGVEAGYIVELPRSTLRPLLGIGNYVVTTTVGGGGGSNSFQNVYLEPGLAWLFHIGVWMLGADANVLFLPGMPSSQASFTAHGQAGIAF